MSIWSIMLLYGVLQGFLLSFVIAIRRSATSISSRTLSLILLLLSMRLLEYTLAQMSFFDRHPQLLYFSIPFVTLFGPLMYFYVSRGHKKVCSMNFFDLLHIMPFILLVVLMIPFYISNPEYKTSYNTHWGDSHLIASAHQIYFLIISIQLPLYTVLTFKLFKNSIRNHNQTVVLRITKIKPILIALILYFIIIIIANASLLVNKNYFLVIEKISFVILSGIIQLGIIHKLLNPANSFFSDEIRKKYKSSVLTEADLTNLLSKIKNLLNTEKLYLDAVLRINDIALKLDVPVPYVSQAINQKTNKSFSDFINEYRISYAKSLLNNPEYKKYTILGIAEFTGFNNKNTFNKAFKKSTGLTPSEFIQHSKGS